MNNPSHRQRGFTLAETLMTLAVASITLSLAIPGLETLTRSNAQAVSVNQLVSSLHLARSEAVTRNARVTVCASRDAEHCGGQWDDGWIAFLDDNADRQHDATESLLDRVPGLADMQLRSAEFARSFSYGSNGRITGEELGDSTGEFSFCAAGADTASRVVIVRATGLPALSDKGRDGAPVECRTT